MQLQKITNFIKPIALTTGMIIPTMLYSGIDSYSGILATSGRTVKYVENIEKNDTSFVFLKTKFQLHVQNWYQQTVFLSSAYDIVANPNFQAIIAMGEQAVPFIKEELQRKPSTLVWALNYIFNKKISDKSNLTITEACRLWIEAL